MSDREATHDRLGADILSAHERLTRTIEARLPAMPLEERERYFAVLSPLVAKLEEIEKPLRQVFREAAAELLPILMQRFAPH
jgi:hypothetical protein